jgi:hypothetical protein
VLYHWVYICCLHQQYPDRDLLLYKYDINAALRRILYHPDIAPAFATMIRYMLCILVGLISGADFSPSFLCNASECTDLVAAPPSVHPQDNVYTRICQRTDGCVSTRRQRLIYVQRSQNTVPADGIHPSPGPTNAPRTHPHEDTHGARSTAPTAAGGVRPRLPSRHIRGQQHDDGGARCHLCTIITTLTMKLHSAVVLLLAATKTVKGQT